MGSSEFLIVLCSPRSAASEWVNREIAWFKTHRDPGKILTLIVDGEPMASRTPGREGEECFPKTLLYKTGADLLPTEEFEDAPLAADARETGDGKRGAKLKLAAAMLGVGLDDLVKRDNRRRSHRRRLVYAGLGSLSFVLGGLSLFAFNQRDAAVAARLNAEAAEKDAKFQAEEAQKLVEFMLTDFRQELDSLGRLDVLERTGKRLLESFAKQDVAKLDANALGRRARVLLLLGEVDNTRGNLDAALARYKEAAATTEELLKRNPGSAQQIFDHAQSVFWVGYIAWQRGDAVLAKKQFTEYYDLAQQLVAIDPDKDEWRMELKYALTNLGTLAMDEGEAAAAEGYFRKSTKIAMALLSDNPENVDRVVAAGSSEAWLADSLYRQAKLVDAGESRLLEIRLYHKAIDASPSHSVLTHAIVVAENSLAKIFLAQNRAEEALTHAIAATSAAAELLRLDPKNASLIESASFAQSYLAESQFRLDQIEEARASLATAIELGERLISLNQGVALWRGVTLPQSKLIQARLEEIDGDQWRAMKLYGEIAVNLKEYIGNGMRDPAVVFRYCAALAGQARLSADFASGWTEIITIVEPTRRKHGPETQALLAEAFARTGKIRDASAAATTLYAAGYRGPDFMALLEEYPELKPSAEFATAVQ